MILTKHFVAVRILVHTTCIPRQIWVERFFWGVGQGLLEFAYEPETSFRVALNAIGGMEASEEDAALVTLGLESGSTPAEVRPPPMHQLMQNTIYRPPRESKRTRK